MKFLRAWTLSLAGFAACSWNVNPPSSDGDHTGGSLPQAGKAPLSAGGDDSDGGGSTESGAMSNGGGDAVSGAAGATAGTEGLGGAAEPSGGHPAAIGGAEPHAGAGGTSGAGGEPAAVGIVGPLGGELVSEDGRARLEVPPGALDAATELSVGLMPNPPLDAVGPVYELSPSGLTFALPVTLTLTVPEDWKTQDFRGFRVATLDGDGWRLVEQQWLEYEKPSVSALLHHFSPYALRQSEPHTACLCDAEANQQCCAEEHGMLGLCSCTKVGPAYWDVPTCLQSWKVLYDFTWGMSDCYDDRAEPPPRYCTEEWEQCCRAAGGIGPIAGGHPMRPVSGEGSQACVCDLGCGSLVGGIDWKAGSFKSCLLRKKQADTALVYEEAVCGPPGAQGGGSTAEGDGYCNGAASPALLGPGGRSWFLYGGPGACADLLSSPTTTLISASLESGKDEKALLGTHLGAQNLSGYVAVQFTAEVTPVGAGFQASLASDNGVRGVSWSLLAKAGMATYQASFASGVLFTNDTIVFDFQAVDQFDVSTDFATGGSVQVKVQSVSFVSGG